MNQWCLTEVGMDAKCTSRPNQFGLVSNCGPFVHQTAILITWIFTLERVLIRQNHWEAKLWMVSLTLFDKTVMSLNIIFLTTFLHPMILFSSCLVRMWRSSGTIRENRTGGANRLIDSRKDFRKTSRGTTDYRYDGKVYVNCWNDNSIVFTASNTFMHEPMHEVKRWKKNAGQVNVKQPDIVYQYNKSMGGVDLFDRLVSSYRPVLRSQKWWWPLFSQVLNTSIVAAWKVHCALSEKAMSHLEFWRSIVLCLLKEVEVEASAGWHVTLPSAVSIPFA